MQVAEALYTKGYISYPRTETDQFDKGIDLKKLIEKQIPDRDWGGYAQEYAASPDFNFVTLTDDSILQAIERQI